MGRGGEPELVLVDTEDGVGVEIDALDVGLDPLGPKRRTEPQSYVFRIEAQKVIAQFRPRGLRQAVNGNGTHPGFDPASHMQWIISAAGGWAADGNAPKLAHKRANDGRAFIVAGGTRAAPILPRHDVPAGSDPGWACFPRPAE